VPRIGTGTFIAPSAAVVGDVEIGARSSVWFGATIRGDDASIRIGDETSVQENAVLHVLERDGVHHHLRVGSRVTIGHSVTLHSCAVADLCIIGMGSTVLDDAEIAERVFLAAGSVVAPGSRLPPGVLAMGAPARVKRDLRPDELAWLSQSAAHYVKRAAEYLEEAGRQAEGEGPGRV